MSQSTSFLTVHNNNNNNNNLHLYGALQRTQRLTTKILKIQNLDTNNKISNNRK